MTYNSCSYLITIRSHCYNNTVVHYQVELIGSKGITTNTITVGNTEDCLCLSKTLCGSFWFHTLVIEQDIGEIQAAIITGKDGASTYDVWELKVKSIINGIKRHAEWDGDHAQHRTLELKNLQKTTKNIDLDIYPVQFTFQSSNIARLEGQPLIIGETGFIQIFSSVPKKSFWDQGITHVASLGDMGEVGIKEIGPKPHKPLSAVCTDLIYPSAAKISHRYDFADRILFSFEVKVRILYVEIESQSSVTYSLAYLNEVNETFMQVLNVERTQRSKTQTLTLKSPLYTKAIKIYDNERNDETSNITNQIQMIFVGGCPSAILDNGKPDTIKEEWTIELSENIIKTNPYLHVIPRSKTTIDPVKVFNEIETHFAHTFSLTFPLSQLQFDCVFTKESLQNYLQGTTAEIKFEIIKIIKSYIEQDQELNITIDIKATNKDEYDRGLTLLNNTIKSAIESQTCSAVTGNLPLQSGKSESTNESSSSSVSIEGIIIIVCVIGVLQLLTLVFLVVKTFRESTHNKAQRQPPFQSPTTSNPGYQGSANETFDE
ncbi:uncharacterized protein LOC143062017 [Mytilus galloprovincialis]|uniref:uncharacterized protein LOC143062017 n=1 Tax=Mytilus galloprovincialis TaxID=29158 RepID=UPI003F7B72B0